MCVFGSGEGAGAKVGIFNSFKKKKKQQPWFVFFFRLEKLDVLSCSFL